MVLIDDVRCVALLVMVLVAFARHVNASIVMSWRYACGLVWDHMHLDSMIIDVVVSDAYLHHYDFLRLTIDLNPTMYTVRWADPSVIEVVIVMCELWMMDRYHTNCGVNVTVSVAVAVAVVLVRNVIRALNFLIYMTRKMQ